MITAGLVVFNLLANAAGSFLVAWLMVRAALFVFRPAPGRARVALLGLPFVKVAFDLARGVPDHSFLWLRARGVPQDLGAFRVGFGLQWIIPKVELRLGALSAGMHYPQSGADLIAAALTKKVSPWAPFGVAALSLLVSAALLTSRVLAWRRATRDLRAAARGAVIKGHHRVGLRTAAILVAEGLEGSPFTGGIFAPYVCFPRLVWDALTPAERRAAIAHELAHVADHHLLILTFAGLVRDLVWFVPFLGKAEARLREGCELAADAGAVRRGVVPAVLASALVRARELMVGRPVAGAATLAAHELSLVTRVNRLLVREPGPRLGFHNRLLGAAITVWVSASVLLAVLFGNP